MTTALKENAQIICSRCKSPVSFEDVSEHYFAVCLEHDEDLFEFETERN